MLVRTLTLLIAGAFASSLLPAQKNDIGSVANGLASDIATSGKKTIAVVDFTDLSGNPTELGRFLAEELSVAFARTHKGFEVIDRTHLKAILTENKLAATGLIDPATVKKIGQIVGADALVTGSMTPFSESVRVTIKVIATDTARIIAADLVDLPKTRTISELLSAGLGASADSPTSSNLRTYLGEWINEDPNRRATTRLLISGDTEAIVVHAWVKCDTADIARCDLGESPASWTPQRDALVVSRVLKYAVSSEVLRLDGSSRLTLSSHIHYTDGSNRPDVTEATLSFIRSAAPKQ